MSGSVMNHPERVVVTGRGVVSPIGSTVEEFERSLIASKGGIGHYDDIFSHRSVHAGLVSKFEPVTNLDSAMPGGCDRAAQLTAVAVSQALSEAGVWDGTKLTIPGEKVALFLGTSHGGRSQLDAFVEAGMDADDPELARSVLEKGAHHHQTAVVATYFGIHGPVSTFSTACSSSGSAISAGMDLLRSGSVDLVIVGGTDGYSKLTHSGFAALGATAESPCGPFSDVIGMTLGEGSAFIVLERSDVARARNADAIGEIYACGTSWDAHHLTAPEPSGDGMRRAIEQALSLANVDLDSIQYINAHATGTRANDISETLAIKRVFHDENIPPISATKSFTGHTLGASSAIGVLAGLTSVKSGKIPPTLNFSAPRPGCDLDYVPQTSREKEVKQFLAQSAAFGGANCVIAGGLPDAYEASQHRSTQEEHICITGMGVISPLGCSAEAFFQNALAGKSGNQQVVDFDARQHLPRGKARRMGAITQFAIAATEQALNDANLPSELRQGERIGLMVGLCRGSVVNFETYLNSVRGAAWEKANPTSFPNLVMSSVGGQISIATGLKGVASTVVGGSEVGFSLLSIAAESLMQREDLDAIVVVAADELTPLYQQLESSRRGGSATLPGAEGAVALTLERVSKATTRGVRIHGQLAGWAQTFGLRDQRKQHSGGYWLAQAARLALKQSDCQLDEVAAVTSLACGEPGADERETDALDELFADTRLPVTAVGGNTGFAESANALYATVSAVMALNTSRLPATNEKLLSRLNGPWIGESTTVNGNVALALGGGEFGANGAIVVKKTESNVTL